MAPDSPYPSYELAVRDFKEARRKAAMQQIVARLRGKSADLLCFDEVRRHLRGGKAVERGIQEITLDRIVGSVGRYKDFTRDFLPKRDSDEARWATVRAAINDLKGMPPIDVYQIGDVYFVQDGNHRVSVARQLGTKTITAHVTEIETRVPLRPEDDPDEVICKADYAAFLEVTNLDQLRPAADLLMTFSGHYQILLDQIEAECRLMGEPDDMGCGEVEWSEAVVKWYDDVYLPVVRLIRELGVMRRFPERTETDLYVLFSEKQEELEEAFGWELNLASALPELADEARGRPLFSRVLGAVAPGLGEGPAPGRWREQQLTRHREHDLFESILVLLEGIDEDWQMLDQVIRLAQMDQDHILGLYVAPNRSAAGRPEVDALRAEFERRCAAAGLTYEFAVDAGRLNDAIIARAPFADLVVINLTNPPSAQPLARLRPGWGDLIERCPRPIMAIPHGMSFDLSHLLLAYDGSSKADEALFVATYLTARWRLALTVVTVVTTHTSAAALERARAYLAQNGVDWAEFVLKEGSINEAILETAAAENVDLVVLGGFGYRPVLRVVLGSTVEHMLRELERPMLICR